MTEYSNVYDPRLPFSDNRAHFLRMNREIVESYFAANGPVSQADGVPNWANKVGEGLYELQRVAPSNDVEHDFGVYISLKAKPVQKYEEGKAKAVATWDYSINIPAADDKYSLQIYSEDTLKYVFAVPNGFAAAVPPRMRQLSHQLATLKFRAPGGELPFMPYVNLAFFMWLEDEAGASTLAWLQEYMGW